jgi:hypothetical protein
VSSAKHFFRRNLTDAGREIDVNDEQRRRALSPIRVSFDPDSIVNEESDVHHENESLQSTSTEAGRQIECNDGQKEHDSNSIA